MQVKDTPETGTGEGTASRVAPSANIRRRFAVKSEPVAVTTQEAIDGHCEKATRIASVEQIELGNIMEISITGQVLRWARQSNLSGGLVVTIRKGEERGICSAALRIVKDQIEERSVVVLVSNRESAIWRNASVKIVLQENVDVEGRTVATNSRFTAEQIKSDKVENVVKDGSKVGKFGNNERQQNLTSVLQCSDEKVTEDRRRSDWRRMRSCHGAERKVNNLEKSDCENLAEERTDEIHRR